jgi:hypothetical protein
VELVQRAGVAARRRWAVLRLDHHGHRCRLGLVCQEQHLARASLDAPSDDPVDEKVVERCSAIRSRHSISGSNTQ